MNHMRFKETYSISVLEPGCYVDSDKSMTCTSFAVDIRLYSPTHRKTIISSLEFEFTKTIAWLQILLLLVSEVEFMHIVVKCPDDRKKDNGTSIRNPRQQWTAQSARKIYIFI